MDRFFGPIFKGAAATVGGPVDCSGRPVTGATSRPAGGTFIIRWGLLYHRGLGQSGARANRLCVPDGKGLLERILQECHNTPLGGHLGRHKTVALVRRLVELGRAARATSSVRTRQPLRSGKDSLVLWCVGARPRSAKLFEDTSVWG